MSRKKLVFHFNNVFPGDYMFHFNVFSVLVIAVFEGNRTILPETGFLKS